MNNIKEIISNKFDRTQKIEKIWEIQTKPNKNCGIRFHFCDYFPLKTYDICKKCKTIICSAGATKNFDECVNCVDVKLSRCKQCSRIYGVLMCSGCGIIINFCNNCYNYEIKGGKWNFQYRHCVKCANN